MTTQEAKVQLRRHTDVLVGGASVLAFGYVAWFVVPEPILRAISVVALAWECWTLVNRFRNDTISEAVARLSHRMPLLTLGVGMLLGYGLAQEWYSPFVAMCLGGLSCHFWFPLKYDPHMEERMLADHVQDEPGPIAQAVAEATPTEK